MLDAPVILFDDVMQNSTCRSLAKPEISILFHDSRRNRVSGVLEQAHAN
jgi:hypothetical protein